MSGRAQKDPNPMVALLVLCPVDRPLQKTEQSNKHQSQDRPAYDQLFTMRTMAITLFITTMMGLVYMSSAQQHRISPGLATRQQFEIELSKRKLQQEPSCGRLVGCALADVTNWKVVADLLLEDVAYTINPDTDYSIACFLLDGTVDEIEIIYGNGQSHTEFSAPYWVGGETNQVPNRISYLATAGTKVFDVKGVLGGKPCFEHKQRLFALPAGTVSKPSLRPTEKPSLSPTLRPTKKPSLGPILHPTERPTPIPTLHPTEKPTLVPTLHPTGKPTLGTTLHPTEKPTLGPTLHPTEKPTLIPTLHPTENPILEIQSPPAVFFEHYNFAGRQYSAAVGKTDYYKIYAAGLNDVFSSYKIAAGYYIQACEHNFAGTCHYLSGSGNVPSHFNDKISSFEVIFGSIPSAILYEHYNFAGRQFTTGVGKTDIYKLHASGFNDLFSSFKIADGYYVKACEHNFDGACHYFAGSGNVPSQFNDKISSLEVVFGAIPSEAAAKIATFYEHYNFAGRQFTADVGAIDYYKIHAAGFNDVFSSYKIANGYYVRACEHNFSGTCKYLAGSGNVPSHFNDKISSFEVVLGSIPSATALSPVVILYEHYNFAGRQYAAGVGTTDYYKIHAAGFNDVFSSYKIANGYYVKACEHNFAGTCKYLTGSGNVPSHFNDKISSFEVVFGSSPHL